jgi:hypothetical protein
MQSNNNYSYIDGYVTIIEFVAIWYYVKYSY